jgi:2-dehydropantoate 2-reductase
VSPQIQKDIWFKLWGNMTVNPISALTGATTDRILDDDLVRGFVSAVMLEAKAIGARSACPLTSSPKTATPSRASWARSRPRCCRTWRRQAVELDALVGVVRELGQITGVPTPFTDALLGLARRHRRFCRPSAC